jgi:hypothetical protein
MVMSARIPRIDELRIHGRRFLVLSLLAQTLANRYGDHSRCWDSA